MRTHRVLNLAEKVREEMSTICPRAHTWGAGSFLGAVQDLMGEVLYGPAPDRDDCPPTHPENCTGEADKDHAEKIRRAILFGEELPGGPRAPATLEQIDAMSLEIKRLTDLVIDLEEIIVYQAGVIREKAEVIEEMEADNKA